MTTRPAAAIQTNSRLTPEGLTRKCWCSKSSHRVKSQRQYRSLRRPGLDETVGGGNQQHHDGGQPHRPQSPTHTASQTAQRHAGDDGLDHRQRMDPEREPVVDRPGALDDPERGEDDVEHTSDQQDSLPPPGGPGGGGSNAGGRHRRAARWARSGSAPTRAMEEVSTLLRASAIRSSSTGDRTGTSRSQSLTSSTAPPVDLDIGKAVHGDERVRQPEARPPAHHRGGTAAGVGVEAVAHHRQLGFVGVPGHHSRVALGHQTSRLRPGRGVVGGRVGARAHRRLTEGPVDPEQGRPGGNHGHDQDEGHQEPESEQPPLGVMVKDLMDAGKEGQQAEEQDGHEGNRHQPQLSDDLAVEETGADEVGDVSVQPLDSFEQRSRCLARLQLGQQVAHHVMAERGVHRRPRVFERVVGIGLVPVHHPHPLGAVGRAHHQIADQRELFDAQAFPEDRRPIGPSQASWPSWLPDRTTTWWSEAAANWDTASVNCGWASRILPTSGGPASISNPSPAITKAAAPLPAPSRVAIWSATAVEWGVATTGRWRSLTTRIRPPTASSNSTSESMRKVGGCSLCHLEDQLPFRQGLLVEQRLGQSARVQPCDTASSVNWSPPGAAWGRGSRHEWPRPRR